MNTPKVKIGSAYERSHFERRSDSSYQCLRPAITADAAKLQAALLSTRMTRREIADASMGTLCIVGLVALILTATTWASWLGVAV